MDVYDHLEPGWAGLLPVGVVGALGALLLRPTVKDLSDITGSHAWWSADPFRSTGSAAQWDAGLRAAWSAWPSASTADLLGSMVHIGLIRVERTLSGATWSLHPTMKPEKVLHLSEGQLASVRRTRHMIRHASIGLSVYEALVDNFASWPVDCTLETLAEVSDLGVCEVRHALQWNLTMKILTVSYPPMVCGRSEPIRIAGCARVLPG